MICLGKVQNWGNMTSMCLSHWSRGIIQFEFLQFYNFTYSAVAQPTVESIKNITLQIARHRGVT